MGTKNEYKIAKLLVWEERDATVEIEDHALPH